MHPVTEYLDIVNDLDEVISTASYQEVYAKRLPHRIIHILIFNDKNELALQLRSATKSFCPLHWSTSVGGHVRAGESYKQAALREFKEELNIQLPITLAFKDNYLDAHGHKKFLATFKTRTSNLSKIKTSEVERVAYFSLSTIQNMIISKEKFHPELLFLLKKHFSIQ